MTLPSPEADLLIFSKALKFMIKLLGSMTISFEFQAIVRVNNVGAILMGSNVTIMSLAKHIDIRYQYMNEHV